MHEYHPVNDFFENADVGKYDVVLLHAEHVARSHVGIFEVRVYGCDTVFQYFQLVAGVGDHHADEQVEDLKAECAVHHQDRLQEFDNF